MVPNDIAAYVSRRFAPAEQGNALRALASTVQADGTPATAGQPGEVCVRGPGITVLAPVFEDSYGAATKAASPTAMARK